jgi:hypothetical protein
MEAWPRLLSELTRGLAANPSDPLPLRLAKSFADVVGADGAAVTLGHTTAQRGLLCATDEMAETIEDTQDVLREGPSLDAFRTRDAVASDSTEEQRQRWPNLVEFFDSRGPLPYIYSFPMRPHTEAFGVMLAYRREAGGLLVSVAEAQMLANAIAVAVLGDLQEESASGKWLVRDRISQATGMVVAQLGIHPRDALALLRAHAFTQATTLSETSAEVLARTLVFSDDQNGDGPR